MTHYWTTISEDSDQSPIGPQGATAEEVLAFLIIWRKEGNNCMRQIRITAESGLVIVDEERL